MKGTASRVVVQAALDALKRAGIETGPVLSASGLTDAALASVDARFPFEHSQRLWDVAAAAAKDSSFGLHVAEQLPDGYDLLDYLFCSSSTLLQGYRRTLQFIRLAYDQSDLRVIEEADQFRLSRAAPFCSRHYLDFVFGYFLFRARRATGVELVPLSMKFRYRAPDDTSALAAAYRCPLTFAQPVTELVFDRSVADLPLSKVDSTLQSVLTDLASGLLRKLPSAPDVEGRVTAAIIEQLPHHAPTVTSVARALKLNARVLQRRLKANGTSFQRLFDDVRRELATSYLSDASLAIGEITYLLGFSEGAAFNRAFKRWTNQTPGEFRNQRWTK